jgi:hypothetical protein
MGVGDRLGLERYRPIRCHGLGSAFVGNTVGEFGRDDAGIDASHTELVIFLRRPSEMARTAYMVAQFDPLLEARMQTVLPICQQRGITIISNMGAANLLRLQKRRGRLHKR